MIDRRLLTMLIAEQPTHVRGAIMRTVDSIELDTMSDAEAFDALLTVGLQAAQARITLDAIADAIAAGILLARRIGGYPSANAIKLSRRRGISSGMAAWMASKLVGPRAKR